MWPFMMLCWIMIMILSHVWHNYSYAATTTYGYMHVGILSQYTICHVHSSTGIRYVYLSAVIYDVWHVMKGH